MAIYKNQTGQKIAIYAHDKAADAPKTGDAANITAQISLDGGLSAATSDVNPTELDATNHPGIYLFDLSQAETNADLIILTASSSTAGIVIESVTVYTLPGSSTAIDAVAQSLGTQAKTDVNTEVLDVLQTDTLVAGVSVAESLRRIGAVVAGTVTGAGDGVETFTDWAGSVNTVVVAVDSYGNRTQVAFN